MFVTASFAAAETPDPAVPGVDASVTVSGRPILQEIPFEPLAGEVTVVGVQQIEDLNAGDPAGALRRVPGLVISRYNIVGSYGGGDGGAVFARGQGTSRPGSELAFSVDGVAKFAGVWTHPLLDNVSVDLAQEIGVYKGAQPVLFGNMAFATIDFVTRRRTEPGFGGKVSGSYGSFATSMVAAEASGRSRGFDFLVSASQRQSDGHRDASDGRTRALFARAGLELGSGWSLALTGDFTSGRASDPGAIDTARLPIVPRFDTRDGMGILTLSRQHGTREGFVKVFVDDGSIDWLQWDGGKQESFKTLSYWMNWGMKARDVFEVFEGGELTVGLDVDSYGGSAREARPGREIPLGDFRFRNVAPYAGLSYTFGTSLKVTPSVGLRYNNSKDFGSVWGAQASLSFTGKPGSAYLRYARAFNLPGVWAAVFYNSYGRGDQWTSLAPEFLDHFEIGLSPRLGSGAELHISLFHDTVKDALRFVPPPPPPPSWANTGNYTARGGEISLSVEPSPAVSFFAGAAYTATDPASVPFTPKWTFSFGASATVSRFRLSADAQWVDDRYVGNIRFPSQPAHVAAYFLMNAKIAARLHDVIPGMEVFVAGENLLDSDYAYRPGYPMPGVSISSGASLRF